MCLPKGYPDLGYLHKATATDVYLQSSSCILKILFLAGQSIDIVISATKVHVFMTPKATLLAHTKIDDGIGKSYL